MPIMIEPRRRGRPPTHPVDRLRTRIWFHVLRLRSGLPSAYAIEMALDREHVRKRSTDVARPRKWDAYEKGQKVPDDKPGPRNAIDQAEARFPGTAAWFRSPLWALLRHDPMDKRMLEQAMRQLSPPIRAVLFEAEPRSPGQAPEPKPFDDEAAAQLLALGSFEALVAGLLLSALSQEIASSELRDRSLRLYIELQAGLMKTPELEPFYPELFSFIDGRFKHWVYLAPNQRMEVVIFWQGVQADAARRAAAQDAEEQDGILESPVAEAEEEPSGGPPETD